MENKLGFIILDDSLLPRAAALVCRRLMREKGKRI